MWHDPSFDCVQYFTKLGNVESNRSVDLASPHSQPLIDMRFVDGSFDRTVCISSTRCTEHEGRVIFCFMSVENGQTRSSFCLRVWWIWVSASVTFTSKLEGDFLGQLDQAAALNR